MKQDEPMKKMTSIKQPLKLFATEVEQEAYDLQNEITLLGHCHSDVIPRTTKAGKPFWVVVVGAPEYDRALRIREKMYWEQKGTK